MLARGHSHVSQVKRADEQVREKLLLPFMKHKEWIDQDQLKGPDEFRNLVEEWTLPPAFHSVLQRSLQNRKSCTSLQSKSEFTDFDLSFHVSFGNETVVSLPSFGIIERIERFREDPVSELAGSEENPDDWHCILPPETECQERKLTVVFMAYNPDRLGKTFNQINTMLTSSDWKMIVEEVVLVWNGPRAVEESLVGQDMLKFAETQALRVVYPLRMGLENDLMNRYHPKVVLVKTKAILYYDDDGPFYSFAAVQGGFELWKRHSSSQVGAMAREITYGERQRSEHLRLLGGQHANDSQFVAHCTNVNDKVDYNYRYFANYDANMVLPSGSILHSNYLCFLWHPVLEPIREFVRSHPVRPDDVTVSMVVSQLAGKAPRVYSRRLTADDGSTQQEGRKPKRRKEQKRRRLTANNTITDAEPGHVADLLRHRRLMFGIDWDAKGGMNDQKKYWAALRTEAINALVQYFGSINSGSIGWCEGSPLYYNEKVDGRCKPSMARIGWLPWMNKDGTPKDSCP
ncbi:hypothetical protein ACA910_016669 [Epithemia clementina (nom. ined.)]